MGVIQRQSIKQSLVNYAAVLIGAFSIIFIYPQDRETYGLARFIIDVSIMIAPFLILGLSGVSVRFFPQFKQEGKSNPGFLLFLLFGVGIGCLIFTIVCLVFKENIYAFYADKPEIYIKYLPYILPITIALAWSYLLFAYITNFKRIVVPSIYVNLIKLTLPILILLYIKEYITLDQVVMGILINFIIFFLGLVAYMIWLGEMRLKFDFSFLTPEWKSEIKSYAFFSLFAGVGNVLAFRIDSFMISTLLDFERNGTYAIAAFIANVIVIPTTAIALISSPIISESFKNDDLDHIRFLYKESSLNLLVFGLLIFVCIVSSIEDLFSIMPKGDELTDGVVIVLLVGVAKLIDMATSVNNQIINYSKYYRFGFYAILFMAMFNIVFNLVLIPKYQIVGAAIATLVSMTLYNLMKMIFIQWRFKMQPFSRNTIWVLLIAVGVYALGAVVPKTQHTFLNIVIKSLVIGLVYCTLIYKLQISKELNGLIEKFVSRFKK